MNIACVGAGAWGRHLLRNFYDLGVLSTVAEVHPGRREEIQKSYPSIPTSENIDSILKDPSIQGIVIATPAETHGSLVRRALLARKDVFVEKPICLSLPEAESLVELAERNARVLMVGHLLWYHPAVLALKDLIVSGELGRIRYLASHRLNLGRVRREEDVLWSFAPHDISVILGLVGEMPEHVATQAGNYLQPHIADIAVSTFSFPSGIRAHLFVSWLHPLKEQKLVVVGDRQMAIFDDLQPKDKLVVYPHSVDLSTEIPTIAKAAGIPHAIEVIEPLRAECQHFLDCIRNRSRPRTDGQEAIRVLRVLQRCAEI